MQNRPTIIGILGGGQLGRMLAQAASSFNVELRVLDSDPDCPCSTLVPKCTNQSFRDESAVYNFGKDCDVITIEIEDVSVPALKRLVAEGKLVIPSPEIIEVIQDKGLQKQFLKSHEIASAPFRLVDSPANAFDQNTQYPTVVKLRRGGYDGRGVVIAKTELEAKNSFNKPCVVEDCVDLQKEIAVIVARNSKAEVRAYDPVEMLVNSDANLVDLLSAPAAISIEQAETAKNLAIQVAQKMNLVGVLAIEMFVTKSGEILVNEMAPRPHNTGHHTIEACACSQFEQLTRVLLGLPLGETTLKQPAVMLNILGQPGCAGPANWSGLDEVLTLANVHLHVYGKTSTKPFRKMGHVTILDQDLTKALEKAKFVRSKLKVIA
jgi:5-(carboxyamino)imidazole ribonucleotide synthase